MKKEIHEKTKLLILLLNINNIEISKIIENSPQTICKKLSEKYKYYHFTRKDLNKILEYNKKVQENILTLKIN